MNENHVGMQPSCRDATLINQPNKLATPPQHFHTIPTSCAIWTCVGLCDRKVVKGNGLGSAHGCVVHVDCA